MAEGLLPKVRTAIGPDGSLLTIENLPSPKTKRWVIRRKAELVAAVRGGLLSLEEACGRYGLTVEEFLAWQSSIDRHGFLGLRATRVQLYREGTVGSAPRSGVVLRNGRFRRRYFLVPLNNKKELFKI
jgi:hypothetical protein